MKISFSVWVRRFGKASAANLSIGIKNWINPGESIALAGLALFKSWAWRQGSEHAIHEKRNRWHKLIYVE